MGACVFQALELGHRRIDAILQLVALSPDRPLSVRQAVELLPVRVKLDAGLLAKQPDSVVYRGDLGPQLLHDHVGGFATVIEMPVSRQDHDGVAGFDEIAGRTQQFIDDGGRVVRNPRGAGLRHQPASHPFLARVFGACRKQHRGNQ